MYVFEDIKRQLEANATAISKTTAQSNQSPTPKPTPNDLKVSKSQRVEPKTKQ